MGWNLINCLNGSANDVRRDGHVASCSFVACSLPCRPPVAGALRTANEPY